MENHATYEDVNLIIRLYELRREAELRKGRAWFAKSFRVETPEEFAKLCPPGSDEDRFARMVITYWEMVASFVTGGVLNEQLLFQSSLELLLVWERARELTLKLRVARKNPMLWKNLETVANAFIAQMNKQGPETYAAFAARVKG